MASEAVKLAKIQRQTKVLDIAHSSIDKMLDGGLTLLANPIVGMVAAVATIEYLQGVEIHKGKTEWQYQDITQSHNKVLMKVKEPLISQTLATTLETAIITSDVIQSLGGLPGLAGVIGKFLGKK